MPKYKTITELAAAMKSGELPMATPCRPYPKGGYGWEFNKGVSFRYWPSHDDSDEEAERKMEECQCEVFDLQAAFDEAGIENGDDNSDSFAKLLLREIGCLA
jgi:hypothetical protein